VVLDQAPQQRHLLLLDGLDLLKKLRIRPAVVQVLRDVVVVAQVDDAVCRLVGTDGNFDLNHAWQLAQNVNRGEREVVDASLRGRLVRGDGAGGYFLLLRYQLPELGDAILGVAVVDAMVLHGNHDQGAYPNQHDRSNSKLSTTHVFL
jgi:hypothetical protein